MGVGSSIFHPEAARLVNRTSAGHRATGIGIFSVGGNAGFGVGPLVAAAALTAWGASGTLLFGVFGILMAAVMLWAVPRMMSLVNRAEKKVVAAGRKLSQGENDWHAFARLSIVILCRSVVNASILAFLPLYCIHRFGVSEAMGGTLLSFLSIAGIFMTVLGGWLGDKIGLVRACKWGYLLMAPAFSLLLPLKYVLFISVIIAFGAL